MLKKKRESGSSLNVHLKPAAHMRKELKKKSFVGQFAQTFPLVYDETLMRNSPREAVKKILNMFDLFCLVRQIPHRFWLSLIHRSPNEIACPTLENSEVRPDAILNSAFWSTLSSRMGRASRIA